MPEGILVSLYDTAAAVPAFCAVSLLSVALGFGISRVYRKVSGDAGTMGTALTVLPFLVQLVILLVNGNLGAGVAVAGTFGLVRFRSAPGTARDIAAIFLAMTVGLCCGMGYWMLAVLAACAWPFLHLGVQYLLYKLAGFLAGLIGPAELCRLVDGLGSAFGLVLGMTGASALALLIAILSSMAAVT